MVSLHISHEKSKILTTSQKKKDQPICLGKTELEYVDKFTYQSSILPKDGDVKADVNMRLEKWHQLQEAEQGVEIQLIESENQFATVLCLAGEVWI